MSTRTVTYAPLVAAVEHGVISHTRASNIEKSYPASTDHDTLPGKSLMLFVRHSTPTLPILEAVNGLWKEIQANHPGTPAVNIVLQSSTRSHGHFSPSSWEGEANHELMLSTVSLGYATNGGEVIKTVSTLLHEAAHAYAHANNIKDTSRGNRYHNKRFAELASAFGCDVSKDTNPNVSQNVGHVTAGISDQARIRYAKQIDALTSAVTVFRKSEFGGLSGISTLFGSDPFAPKPRRAYGSQTVVISCDCPTSSHRVPRALFESSTISCDVCNADYSE